jgi:hypothetical protein
VCCQRRSRFAVDTNPLFTIELLQEAFNDLFRKQNQEITLSKCANLTSRDLERGAARTVL